MTNNDKHLTQDKKEASCTAIFRRLSLSDHSVMHFLIDLMNCQSIQSRITNTTDFFSPYSRAESHMCHQMIYMKINIAYTDWLYKDHFLNSSQSADGFINSLAFGIMLKSHISFQKILWLVHLLSHHKRTTSESTWKQSQTCLFKRSRPGCLVRTRVKLTASAQHTTTLNEQWTRVHFNWTKQIMCGSTLKERGIFHWKKIFYYSIMLCLILKLLGNICSTLSTLADLSSTLWVCSFSARESKHRTQRT